jgi:periplasmic protein TonB
MGNGKWGTSVVTFVVSASGQVEGLQLIKSAGDDWLDKSALMAVKQARMPVPPAGLPLGDRKFVIEYISLPFRTR